MTRLGLSKTSPGVSERSDQGFLAWATLCVTSTASGPRSMYGMYGETSEKLSSVSVLASTLITEIPIASRHDPEIFLALFHRKLRADRSPLRNRQQNL